jgi:hypothetical protein
MRVVTAAVCSSALVCFGAACGKKSDTTDGLTSGLSAEGPAGLSIPKVDASLCATDGKKVATFDLNRDSRPDVWKLYKTVSEGGTSLEILTCKQADLDHDGQKDYVVGFNDTGGMLFESFDLTFDGHFDARTLYDPKGGKVYLIERDSDYDKTPDIWEKFDTQGGIEQVLRDRNRDRRPDVWEQYKTGTLVAILYDDDYDNKVDRKEQVESQKKAITPPPIPSDEQGGAKPAGQAKPPADRPPTPAGQPPAPAAGGKKQ